MLLLMPSVEHAALILYLEIIYFKKRLTEARRDVEHGLGVTLDYFSTSREMQEKALDILQFKINVLWVIADSIMLASSSIKVDDRDYMRQPK